jgi:hypothetical protein
MTEPEFAFGKRLGITEHLYGDHQFLLDMIARLFVCMKQTNKNFKTECEFFRLDFRNPYFDEKMEFPLDCLILDLKWGSKKELEEIQKEQGK